MPGLSAEALKGRTIRCILFDFGDTLWTRRESTWRDTEIRADQKAAAVLLQAVDIDEFPVSAPTPLGHLIRKATMKQIYQQIRKNPDVEPDFPQVVCTALEDLGLPPFSREVAAEIFEALRIRIPESRVFFDDAISTLLELKRRGYLLGGVTNRQWGHQPFHEDIRQLGLLEIFELPHIAISADLGLRKPNPDIFLYALNALGVAPTEAAMVGDSFHADVVGAKQLDIFAIWMPTARLRAEIRSSLPPNPEESHVEDDELLANVRRRGPQISEEIQPDLTIAKLSELLDVFS